MATNEIRILIGGDVAGLTKASQQGATALENLGTAAEGTSQSLSQIGPSVQKAAQNVERFKAGLRVDPTGQTSLLNVSNNLKKVENSSRAAAAAVRQFSNATSAGNGVVTDFSRVIQDLPFGLIGITNNLTQLPGTLQRFSAAAKESGKSMGSLLLSSVTGFGGIGLALSLVTSGLVIAQNGIAGFGRASKKAKEDADELAQTIRSIAEIQGEATGGIQGQISQINALAGAIADSNRPYEERRRALEELRGINKAYFGDLQLEDAATGKLTKTIEEYNKALIAQAIVKSFVNEIAEVAKAAAKADTELANATNKLTRAERDLKTARATSGPTGREGTGVAAAEADAQKALITAFEAQRAAREKALDLTTQQVVLQGELNKAQLESLKFKTLDTAKGEKDVDLLQKRLTALEKIKDVTKDLSVLADLEEQIFDLKVKITLRDAAKNGLSKEETDLAIKGFRDQLTDAFNKEALALEGIIKIKATKVEFASLDPGIIESEVAKATGFDKKIPIKSDRQVRIELLGIEFVLAEEQARAAAQRLQDTILNGATDALASTATAFGELIAGAFSGEGIGNSLAKAAQTLLSGIGGVLQEIGKQVIATSVLVKALKESLKTLFANPVAALGVGLGLIALGGLLKSIKIPGFAGGVNNFSGGLAIVGERGPELVNLPRGSSVIPNHLIGNDNNITLLPSIRFDGAGFVIMTERVQNRRARLG